jgi:hypothetical protein
MNSYIIKRIINGEECKKYKLGFIPEENKDYLLLEDKEYILDLKKKRYKLFKFLFLINFLPSVVFIFSAYALNLPPWLYIAGTITSIASLVFIHLSYPKRKNQQVKQLIPVDKGNNFKLDDEVKLNFLVNRK